MSVRAVLRLAIVVGITLWASRSGARDPLPAGEVVEWHFADPGGYRCIYLRVFSDGGFEREDCSPQRELEAEFRVGGEEEPHFQRGRVSTQELARFRTVLRDARLCGWPASSDTAVDGTGYLSVSLGRGLECQVQRTRAGWQRTTAALAVRRAIDRLARAGCAAGCTTADRRMSPPS